LWTIVLFCFLTGCATTRGFEYPPARKADVVDDYHGTRVPDPYRWLEDAKSEETLAWVEAQNRLTCSYVDTPLREKLQERLTEIWNYPKYSIPNKVAGRYFFQKNDGLQNQDVYYVQDGLAAEPRVVLDPNKLSEDGTTALTGARISEDGKLMAYLIPGKTTKRFSGTASSPASPGSTMDRASSTIGFPIPVRFPRRTATPTTGSTGTSWARPRARTSWSMNARTTKSWASTLQSPRTGSI